MEDEIEFYIDDALKSIVLLLRLHRSAVKADQKTIKRQLRFLGLLLIRLECPGPEDMPEEWADATRESRRILRENHRHRPRWCHELRSGLAHVAAHSGAEKPPAEVFYTDDIWDSEGTLIDSWTEAEAISRAGGYVGQSVVVYVSWEDARMTDGALGSDWDFMGEKCFAVLTDEDGTLESRLREDFEVRVIQDQYFHAGL